VKLLPTALFIALSLVIVAPKAEAACRYSSGRDSAGRSCGKRSAEERGPTRNYDSDRDYSQMESYGRSASSNYRIYQSRNGNQSGYGSVVNIRSEEELDAYGFETLSWDTTKATNAKAFMHEYQIPMSTRALQAEQIMIAVQQQTPARKQFWVDKCAAGGMVFNVPQIDQFVACVARTVNEAKASGVSLYSAEVAPIVPPVVIPQQRYAIVQSPTKSYGEVWQTAIRVGYLASVENGQTVECFGDELADGQMMTKIKTQMGTIGYIPTAHLR
jgi:hypothetical protein